MLPALGAGSMNRAADSLPHHGYIDPNVLMTGPQTRNNTLPYPNPQDHPFNIRGDPSILVPQPGTPNVESFHSLDVAGVPTHAPYPAAPFDGHSASPLEISEESGSGGVGAFPSVGYASNLNEREYSAWTRSTAAGGQYGGQLPGHPYFSQPPYNTGTHEYIVQSGTGGAFKFCHDRRPCLTIWS